MFSARVSRSFVPCVPYDICSNNCNDNSMPAVVGMTCLGTFYSILESDRARSDPAIGRQSLGTLSAILRLLIMHSTAESE